jgi:hypothetical protein
LKKLYLKASDSNIKFLVTIFFLLSFAEIKPQNFKLGGSFGLMLGNKYLAYNLGPTVNIEYLLEVVPISINGCVRLHLSELNDETYKFSWGYTYTIYSLGTIIKYYPISWDIEPYIALGLFYNFNNVESSGHPAFINGYLVGQKIVEYNFATEITGGLILSAKTPANLFVEVTQTFNKPNYDLIMIDSDGNKTTKNEEFNFNSLFLKLGVLFSL